jgi:hypothetical protein
MAAIIRKTESEEHKAALYQEAEGLLNDILARARSTLELTAMRGIALTGILHLRHNILPC